MTDEEFLYLQSLTYQPSAAVPWLQSIIGGDSMLGQDDQAYWDAYYESIGMFPEQAPAEQTPAAADDQASWDAYYAVLANPEINTTLSPYEYSLEWGLPSLAITPEAALADSEAALQQAIADSNLVGQPMSDSDMQSYIDSQAKQIIAAYPSTGTGIVQKLKDFASNLSVGGGSAGSGGSGGSSTKAQIPVAATTATGTTTASTGISSTMMIALAALAAVAFLASSGHSRA
jgi:hypothetical protein